MKSSHLTVTGRRINARVVRQVVGYGVAVLAVGVAHLVWHALTGHVGPSLSPFLTYYPGVVLTATLCGLGPGLLATALSATLAAYWILPPDGFAVESAVDVLGLCVFTGMGIAMSLVVARHDQVRHRAAAASDQAIRTHAQALQASEQRYRSLVELAPDAVLVHRDGRIVYANSAAVRLYGAEGAAQLHGTDMLDLVHPDDRTIVADRIQQAVEGHTVPTRPLRHRRLDGREVPVETMAVPIEWQDQVAVQVIVRDVTERQQAEAALRSAQLQLERRVEERTVELAKTLTKQAAQAEQLRALTGELAVAEQQERQRLSQLLHDDLQQLLVAIRMRIQILRRADPARVPDACTHVLALVDAAIKFSRSLSAELSPTILQSAGFLPALEWLAHWMEDTHQLTVDLKVEPSLEPESETAKGLLFQSVRELLFNVVKHAGVSQATVEVLRTDAHIQIAVADQGVGFDPARIPPLGNGGLGLPGIRQRLEYLGGKLEIASTPGQGSRFTLLVPLRPGEREPAPGTKRG